jgi:hypothetical protein
MGMDEGRTTQHASGMTVQVRVFPVDMNLLGEGKKAGRKTGRKEASEVK